MAAYILEKFSTWTNKNWKYLPNGGLENLNKVELLDHIMLYWLTKSITTSMRLYSENFNATYFSSGIERQVYIQFCSNKTNIVCEVVEMDLKRQGYTNSLVVTYCLIDVFSHIKKVEESYKKKL